MEQWHLYMGILRNALKAKQDNFFCFKKYISGDIFLMSSSGKEAKEFSEL